MNVTVAGSLKSLSPASSAAETKSTARVLQRGSLRLQSGQNFARDEHNGKIMLAPAPGTGVDKQLRTTGGLVAAAEIGAAAICPRRICSFPRRSTSGSIIRMQATDPRERGAFLFAVLLLLLSLVPLHAQPAAPASTLNSALATRRVLELDGTNSYVELPLGAFTNLDEVTVEGWVKWESFGNYSHFFDLTLAGYTLIASNFRTIPDLLAATFHGSDAAFVEAPGMLSTGSWIHVAVVSGKQGSGLKLFANGALVTTNTSRSVVPTATPEKPNFLGRSKVRVIGTPVPDFHGQMAEVRLWRGERTEAQIRENLFKNLTGKEEGLAGLWNFADGTANDSSPRAQHGKLMGPGQGS
ncbi:MAG: LamG domain-containing protein [Pedosphaera sp.]|nr:LamG domain-containing protein [Pedosphaera sp.]